MRADFQRKVAIVLEAEREGLSAAEVCRKYGIKRQTYYNWRREVTRAGLLLMQEQLARREEGAEEGAVVAHLQQAKAQLEERIEQLERARMVWELRYKLLRWHLEKTGDTRLQKIVGEVAKLVPERLENGA
ncbi:MAG: transposase [Bacillota bacterium]